MSNKKILVVEDDQNTRNLYQTVLSGAGFQVDTAVDGNDGLTKCQSGGYDLVLLDVMLPKLDGIGILTGLKKNPPKVPNKNIYMLTNLAHDPILKEAIELGAKEVILKTDINPEELVKKVQAIFAN